MPTEASIVLGNEPHELEKLGSFIQEFWAANGLAAGDALDVNLALEELFMNVVMHGHASHDTVVRLKLEDSAVAITLEDDGIAFDPLAVELPRTDEPVEQRRVGGLGILLARKFMDHMEYKRQGAHNILLMKKRT